MTPDAQMTMTMLTGKPVLNTKLAAVGDRWPQFAPKHWMPVFAPHMPFRCICGT